MTNQDLLAMQCGHATIALTDTQINAYLATIPGWAMAAGKLCKTFSVNNYYENLAFFNACALVFHADDHHPETHLSYNRCSFAFDTHSVNEGRGGISINDFICAAKVDALFNVATKNTASK